MLLISFMHSFSFELGIPEGTGSLASLFVVSLGGLSEHSELMPAVWCNFIKGASRPAHYQVMRRWHIEGTELLLFINLTSIVSFPDSSERAFRCGTADECWWPNPGSGRLPHAASSLSGAAGCSA